MPYQRTTSVLPTFSEGKVDRQSQPLQPFGLALFPVIWWPACGMVNDDCASRQYFVGCTYEDRRFSNWGHPRSWMSETASATSRRKTVSVTCVWLLTLISGRTSFAFSPPRCESQQVLNYPTACIGENSEKPNVPRPCVFTASSSNSVRKLLFVL